MRAKIQEVESDHNNLNIAQRTSDSLVLLSLIYRKKRSSETYHTSFESPDKEIEHRIILWMTMTS